MDIINIKSEDWLKNAGICGLYNILCEAGDREKIQISYDEIIFPIELLENFSEKYFNYFIKTYQKTFSLYKIISTGKTLENWINNDFNDFNDKSLEILNSNIENFKKYMKSNSYKSAYKLIEGNFDPELEEKELKKIKLKKKENVEDRLEEIKHQVNLMKSIVDYFKSEEAIKYVGAKNSIYNIIRNAWDGVSFLNKQCKNPDMYSEYQEYFINPVIDYAKNYEEKKKTYKYQCISCSSKIKDLNSDVGFIREMGFDTGRKTSHVWDFNNYVGICPICKFIYSCVPAGINYVYNRGIFINYSMNMEDLFRINTSIRESILEEENSRISVFKSLQEAMNKKINDEVGYELSDIQVVRFYRDIDNDSIKYNFNIINKPVLNTINFCKNQLETIKKGSYIENDSYVYIYNEVIKKLLDNENQFLLIQKLLHYKLSMPDTTYYNAGVLASVLKLNVKYLQEVGYMEKSKSNSKDGKERDIIDEARKLGYHLQIAYNKMIAKDDNTENNNSKNNKKYNKKLNSIAYRMLNSLKTNNKHSFMDVLINSYMYVGKAIPKIFAENLDKDLEFKNIGYAFITGMIGYSKEDDEADSESLKKKN